MFSGIIRYLGILKKITKTEGYITVENKELPDIVEIGGSVAVNGACLTLVSKDKKEMEFFVSSETIDKSTIPYLKEGTVVNLELPCTPTTLLDGHIVQGHIDTIGKVKKIDKLRNTTNISIQVPKEFMKYISMKGSIAVDGISLTVSDFSDSEKSFKVSVIPFTFANTNLKYLQPGDYVNIEFDIISKYIERLLHFESHPERDIYSKLKEFLGT